MVALLSDSLSEMLSTIVEGISDTIRDRPHSTIVPRARRESASARALEMLRQLSGDHGDGVAAELILGVEIARGGMGRIRVAEQVALGREVAVKTLREELNEDIGATLELLREAWVTGALEHPNIMPVYNIALAEDGSPLIVLKRIEGVTWTELMTDEETVLERYGAVDLLEWNLETLLRVLDALRFAHSRRIIHRDVKPDNVMVGEFGEVYLVDWGIAVSLERDPSGRLPHVSATLGAVAGTPCYMAPEMLGEQQDELTDVYLAGSVLFELIAGRPPHLGKSVLEVLTNVATSEPSIPVEAPEELAAICRTALARDPAERFAGAEEMRVAVVRFISHRGSLKLSDGAAVRLGELGAHLEDPALESDIRRESVYRLLGECRSGFGAALSAWPENRAAKEGLSRALSSVASFELDNDDPGAADSLLTELGTPPVQLRAKIDEALKDRALAREHYAVLADEADFHVGNRTRIVLTVVLGVLWTGLPLVAYVLDRQTGFATGEGAYWRMLLVTLGVLFFVAGLAGWARESLTRSRVNRLIAATMTVALLVQLIMLVGAYLMGLDAVTSQVLMPLMWAVGAIVLTLVELRAAMPLAFGFVAAFLLGAAYPDYRLLFMSGANFIVFVNAMMIWIWSARTGGKLHQQLTAIDR